MSQTPRLLFFSLYLSLSFPCLRPRGVCTINFTFYLMCARCAHSSFHVSFFLFLFLFLSAGYLCFHPAGIVRGPAGGACINNFTFFCLQCIRLRYIVKRLHDFLLKKNDDFARRGLGSSFQLFFLHFFFFFFFFFLCSEGTIHLSRFIFFFLSLSLVDYRSSSLQLSRFFFSSRMMVFPKYFSSSFLRFFCKKNTFCSK